LGGIAGEKELHLTQENICRLKYKAVSSLNSCE
jgi:hypothetical protein